MKRFIAVLLCTSILISLCGVAASAEEREEYPVILISGFMCSNLFLDYGTPAQEKVWPPEVNKIT